MSENTVIREIVAPDGTQYEVYTDGSWVRRCWDGSFVSEVSFLGVGNCGPDDEVLRKVAENHPPVPGSEYHRVVCPDGTEYKVFPDGTWNRRSWDGLFVCDYSNASTTPEEVVAKLGL